MTGEGLNYAKSWGVSETFITRFDTRQRVKQEYKIFINQAINSEYC